MEFNCEQFILYMEYKVFIITLQTLVYSIGIKLMEALTLLELSTLDQ